uniref:Uncharacterized protein n=1 Tax=Tanacetum cinerariifolium TaxID=118510 RepID=A0A699HN69_TANCI|nr:hypothetical protein [Tanacetum cinerariifolium]
MNSFFTKNPNKNDEERPSNAFEVDDETNIHFLSQAYEYHEHLQQEENCPRLTRNPIHRDREGADERLMTDYFDDYFRPDATGKTSLSVIMKCTAAIHQLAYGNTPDAFDEYLQRQKSARKDVERAFGVLHGRGNNCTTDQQMAVTDWNDVYANPSRNMKRTWVERCEVQRRKAKELRDRETHISL